jgi:hypothetical protein
MGVACPSTIQCTAVDSGGRAVTGDPTNPASWSIVEIAGATFLSGIACTPPAQCVAVDQAGDGFLEGP